MPPSPDLTWFRQLVDASSVALGVLDRDLRYVHVNAALAEINGIPAEAHVGRTVTDVLPGLDAEVVAAIRSVVTDGVPRLGFEAHGETPRMPSVRRRWVADYVPLRGEDGSVDGVGLIVTETTEQARLERELASARTRLETVMQESPLATVILDHELQVQLWNRAAAEMFGWSEEEVLGKPLPIMPDDLVAEFDAMRRRVLTGEVVRGLETRRRRRDGSEVWVAVYDAPLRAPGGEIRGIALRMADIGERRRLEAELFEARRMESIGRLAGGIAHDFNNILTAIIGYADLALADPSGPDVADDVATIKASAERAAALTRQLLAFGRRQMLHPEVVVAADVLRSVEPLLRRLIDARIELDLAAEPDAGAFRVDPVQLQQVILNLALNARDAMPGGGRLILRVRNARFDESQVSRHFEMAPGDYVAIEVTDTGAGMDPETRAHLFEPFYTTKGFGQGSGLGLATTYGIVRQSGGHIWVYSEVGRGTTFKVYFPAVEASVAAEAPRRPAGARRTGRVLLVEDEPVLRDLARIVLERRGFEVLTAGTAAQALALVSDGADGLDLLLSDVVMPGMTGNELANRLRELRPALPVLLISGYAEEMVRSEGAEGIAFLAKPFTPETLLGAVDGVLAGPETTGEPVVQP